MSSIVLAIPIVTGKLEAWRRFCQELSGSRLQNYVRSRRRLGITRERMELIETPFGSKAVNTIEAGDIGSVFAQIATSDDPFDHWYRERLYELHGISLSSPEQFEQAVAVHESQELVFEWALGPPMLDDARGTPQGEAK